MPIRLDTSEPDFNAGLAAWLDADRGVAGEVEAAVSAIIADVRARGDRAVCELTEKFDRTRLTPAGLRFTEAEIEAGLNATPAGIRDALEFAHDRITAHHEKQRPADHVYSDGLGVTLGTVWHPLAAVGVYVPGGLASYPSSVLMNAAPASVAGVGRIAMTVPTPKGQVNPAVLAAASIAGVSEIYRVGGAQAIAALAFGTASIPSVDKIVGPGNAFVAAAKRQLYGVVGIDTIAGPSEVLVIADSSANPAWVAADLLAQIEHGAGARGMLVAIDRGLADGVVSEVARQIETLPRAELARDGWNQNGAIIVASSLNEAIDIANRCAPEHIELALDEPGAVLHRMHNAGAVFLGHYTPEAIGDYVGGTNHVLPTGRTARFASGLGVADFMKRTSVLGCDRDSLAALSDPARTLADAEGLEAHARSIAIRLNR